MIQRIKHWCTIYSRPVETTSAEPRKIHVELSPDARRRYTNAALRYRRIYFPRGTYKPKPEIPVGQQVSLGKSTNALVKAAKF
jgi:hypothetical protein